MGRPSRDPWLEGMRRLTWTPCKKKQPSRPPPGGHSSIIFGDDISSSLVQEPSPMASPVKPRTTSSIIGSGADDVAMPSPTRTGRRMASIHHQKTGNILAHHHYDDRSETGSSAAASDDGSSESGSVAGRNATFDGAAGITSPMHTPRRHQKRHGPANAHRSSVIFGDDDAPKPTPPTRAKSPSIIPYDDSPSPAKGRRKPDGVAPNFKSSFSLAHAADATPSTTTTASDSSAPASTTASTAASSAASSPKPARRGAAHQSSIVLGDDSPPAPDFSPKKLNKLGGRRIISPPGGTSNLSLAEFAGALPEAEGRSSKERQRADPAAMDPAGRATGKHRIY
ncbi:hypothetical protein HDU96_011047 [Phlyctochytrium bullatum]|nr:hypothetical protein HDU96_011047 [Phlyctochytrium bullatum]